MKRKPATRTASAAAAAANVSDTPTFTSFAAATAQVLQGYSSSATTPPEQHEWDSTALQLLKKLSKRDATTKEKALMDLSEHIKSLPSDSSAGTAFVTAWGESFRATVQDVNPAVRIAALRLMGDTVLAFRRAVQHIFPSVLPLWLAAQGDLNASVSSTAFSTLERVLPTEERRKKVFSRYAEELKSYCYESISQIGSSDNFLVDAKRVIAILKWLLDASQTTSSISSLIDAEPHPLLLFAKGRKKKRESESALRDVCELAVFILSFMECSSSEDQSRAIQFADIAVYAIRKAETSGWDLTIVLLRDGWSSSFGSDLNKLSTVVCESVASPVPTGIQALLPLFESLPHEEVSGPFAEKVLISMKEYLHPSRKGKKGVQITVSYALTALLTYIQTASYSQRVLAARWYGNEDEKIDAFARRIFNDHVVPTCQLFVSGILPPVTKQTSESITSGRRSIVVGSDKNVIEISRAFGHVLRAMKDPVSSQVISDIASSFALSLADHTPDEQLRRFEYLIDVLEDDARENQLVEAGVMEIVKTSKVEPEVAVKALATLLSGKAGKRLAVSKKKSTSHGVGLLSEMREFCLSLMRREGNANNEEIPHVTLKEIAGIFSWIYTSSACLDEGYIWSSVVTDVRLTCSKETEYIVLAETIFAQKKQRELYEDMGWIPVMGRSLDTMTTNAVTELVEQGVSDSAIRFICAAVDVKGGARLSKASRKQIIIKTIEALGRDGAEKKMDQLIEAMLSSITSELGSEDFYREFVSATVIRALQKPLILTQIICYIKSCPLGDLFKLSESIGSMLLRFLERTNVLQLPEIVDSVSELMSAFAKRRLNLSASLCKKLLSDATPLCTSALLRRIQFKHVFGDGLAQEVNIDFFNETVEKAYAEPHKELDVGLHTYLDDLLHRERLRIGLSATRLLLSRPRRSSEKVLGFLLKTTTDSSSEEIISIAEELKRFWLADERPKAPVSKELASVPLIVRICSVQTHGKCVGGFRPFLEHIVSASLKDMLTTDTFWAMETLAASLHGFLTSSSHGQAKLPPWLWMIVLKAVQRGREKLEQLSSSNVEAEKTLEASLAKLLRVAIQCFRFEALLIHELTYWASRIRYIFQGFISQHSEQLSWDDAQRMCFLTGLSEAIINVASKGFLGFEIIEELCYWGAWISVILIPYLEKNTGNSIGAVDAGACAEWCGNSILAAAEMESLLRGDRKMPIPIRAVYSLIPCLTSSLAVVRKAILIVVVHAATADLAERVVNAFPMEGFANEEGERAFIDDIIPSQLRDALEWPELPNALEEQNQKHLISIEVGYLLAWRIFLDLLRSEDSNRARSIVADTEDLSFRRVGLSYLEEHPKTYKDFFKRCIDIVVDGSTEELQFARRAAIMAIQTEENAASGVIVAKSAKMDRASTVTSDDPTRKDFLGDNSDATVGHAAGIAFARALQRLPALSREVVTHELERGAASRVEAFVRGNLAPLLIAAEVRKVKEWGEGIGSTVTEEGEGELTARGSVAGREVWATYRFSDVTLEIGMRIPDVFPLQTATVEARSRIGMSEAQWRKTLLGMATLLRAKNGSLAEALALWRRNLDKTFQGAEECPICYSVLHVATAALPKKSCRTCRNSFHSDCLLRWFSTSNTCACPTCRSVF
eukprot:gb/GEZJ01000680.1/.p1 GENE.gb/GEZJ01000680.1/~~gb/GEZJ01000680.1/.p1  ORF type:complete len:1636 (-),score=254.12 gb/GEZJ01000680.1/:2920-7827(-)